MKESIVRARKKIVQPQMKGYMKRVLRPRKKEVAIRKEKKRLKTKAGQYSTDQRRVHTWVASPDTPPPPQCQQTLHCKKKFSGTCEFFSPTVAIH